MARPVLHWVGSKPPTRRELAAVRRAWVRGDLRSGDSILCQREQCAVGRALPNPSPIEDAYEQFHWGRPPRRRRLYGVHSPREVFELGKLRAVEYEATKGNQHAIWVHKFTWPRPVLTGTADGKLGPILGGSARVTERGIVG